MRLATMVIAATLLAAAAPAPAQVFRAYLSTAGNDLNDCTLNAPCRLLPAAIAKVADGGEVWMLESGNYNTGTVSVTKSVSILSVPGVQGSVVVNGATAIAVSGGNVTVALRNVFVVPVAGASQPTTAYGLLVTGSSATAVVDRCVFAGLPSHAVQVSGGRVVMIDSVVRDSVSGYAVHAINSGGNISISGSKLINNPFGGVGVQTSNGGTATITDSVIINYERNGTGVDLSASQGNGRAAISGVRIEGTASAIRVSPGQFFANTASLSRSMIIGNDTAFSGVIQSLGDNHVAANAGLGSTPQPLDPM